MNSFENKKFTDKIIRDLPVNISTHHHHQRLPFEEEKRIILENCREMRVNLGEIADSSSTFKIMTVENFVLKIYLTFAEKFSQKSFLNPASHQQKPKPSMPNMFLILFLLLVFTKYFHHVNEIKKSSAKQFISISESPQI